MTLKEIKSELKYNKLQAHNASQEHKQELLPTETTFAKAMQLLNQLSAPSLKWIQVNPKNWTADTPTGKYQVSLSEGDWNCIHEHDLFVSLGFLSEETAKSAAETHWDKLYKQIINL